MNNASWMIDDPCFQCKERPCICATHPLAMMDAEIIRGQRAEIEALKRRVAEIGRMAGNTCRDFKTLDPDCPIHGERAMHAMTTPVDLRERLAEEAFYWNSVDPVKKQLAQTLILARNEIEDCICRGNWRKIVKDCEPLIGKNFTDRLGNEFNFFGVVHGDDDYWYGMYGNHRLNLLSCMRDLAGHGYTLIEEKE